MVMTQSLNIVGWHQNKYVPNSYLQGNDPIYEYVFLLARNRSFLSKNEEAIFPYFLGIKRRKFCTNVYVIILLDDIKINMYQVHICKENDPIYDYLCFFIG